MGHEVVNGITETVVKLKLRRGCVVLKYPLVDVSTPIFISTKFTDPSDIMNE
jgi:hypothetical protein